MVTFTLGIEVKEEGQSMETSGIVYRCEDDHVVCIDGLGNLKHIAYDNISVFEKSWKPEYWPTEPK